MLNTSNLFYTAAFIASYDILLVSSILAVYRNLFGITYSYCKVNYSKTTAQKIFRLFQKILLPDAFSLMFQSLHHVKLEVSRSTK